MFIHGLWLLPSSWDRWATVFEEAGYTALTPGWPDDSETVEEANARSSMPRQTRYSRTALPSGPATGLPHDRAVWSDPRS